MEKHAISQGTVYNWIRQWNNGGIEGLKRKKGSKGNSKLTNDQLIELDNMIQEENLETAKEVQEKIKKEFGVDYHIRSIERIMKKLNYLYSKSYQIYTKIPSDVEE